MALILRIFVVGAYRIPTGSMIPTLQPGDMIFAWKLPYGIRLPGNTESLIKPKIPPRGSVVIFRYPEKPHVTFIKRVVGLPGDKIEIKENHVFLNDKKSDYQELSPKKSQEILGQFPYGNLYKLVREKALDLDQLILLRKGERENFGPTVVPPGHIFVLGDNRYSSDDSRFWGLVPVEGVEARAFIIWASLDWDAPGIVSSLPGIRWQRVFKVIH